MGRLVSMSRTLETPELAERARMQARDAAGHAGVEVRLLSSPEEFQAASEIFLTVWGTGPANAQMPADVMRALTHSGSYVAGAMRADSMVGAVVGFLGRDDRGSHLHSHILGVTPGQQTRGVGYALKEHQRGWALDQGLKRVMWTFDPLVRRNAYFNLHKLGAAAAAYFENFYGSMSDGVNAGDESDRLFIEWTLDSSRVVDAANGRRVESDVDALIDRGASVALSGNESGRPSLGRASGSTVLCATPDDVVSLRRAEAKIALEWRHALRDTLGAAMSDGFAVSGFTRSGWYVLERDGRGGADA
jgi:predicted GNAT superfamily acetyltransferase